MRAYYNDHDKNVCLWLEQLIKNGDITKGDVDDRSITEINPEDISGYDRVHLFAGIGTWDYALNQAGWGDKPVLTASLPCQPFSAAGKGLGKQDERHLLPQAINLIIQSGIDTIFGEQVEKAIKFGWLDDLQTIMEAEGYAVGHCVLGAHSVNAAHIRQRLYWVANAVNDSSQRTIRRINGQEGRSELSNWKDIVITGDENSLSRQERGYPDQVGSVTKTGSNSRMADTENIGNRRRLRELSIENAKQQARQEQGENKAEQPVYGLADDPVEWLWCRDNKYRPIKPGIKPLVDGATGKLVCGSDTSAQIEANGTQEARQMRLKGYGNAIQAQTAEMFIRAYIGINDNLRFKQ